VGYPPNLVPTDGRTTADGWGVQFSTAGSDALPSDAPYPGILLTAADGDAQHASVEESADANRSSASAKIAGYKEESFEPTTVGGTSAYHWKFTQTAPGQSVVNEFYFMVVGNRVFVVSETAGVSHFDEVALDRFVHSLRPSG
jgi:hypothetical protein